MPTLLIHHRKRLVLRKLTNYVKNKRRMMNVRGLLGQVPTLNHYEGHFGEDDDEEQLHMPPGADLPFENIHLMSKQQREKLRKQFPNLPPYMFMIEKEKRVFFRKRSQQYTNKLLKVPQRASKTKKIVKFEKQFDVRPFRKNEAVVQVNKTKSFKDSYQNYHFS